MKVGVLVNPLAGIGGAVALKGSDGAATVAEALARGAVPQAVTRAERALRPLAELPEIELVTWAGEMGEHSARAAGFEPRVLGTSADSTSAADTRAAAAALLAEGVDLLLFAGGDGTARDVLDAVGTQLPVLGIPAGCKMHSGVYAVNPEAAAELVKKLALGDWVNVVEAEVRDIDEEAFRRNQVRARYYGSLKVPVDGSLVQQVKCGAEANDALEQEEIAQFVVEQLAPDITYLIGSGSTCFRIKELIGIPGTLLGVDVVRNDELLQADATAQQLLDFVTAGECRAVLSVIGGQGHLLGRGNQQFSPEVVRALGKEKLIVLASRRKLASLASRPLLLDSGDAELDRALSGLIEVTAGYEEHLLYPLSFTASVIS